MQAFSGDARVTKCRLVVAAMLDSQNLRELGRGAHFPFRLIPTPSVALSTLPNLLLYLNSKMAAIAFAHPRNTPALQAIVLITCRTLVSQPLVGEGGNPLYVLYGEVLLVSVRFFLASLSCTVTYVTGYIIPRG